MRTVLLISALFAIFGFQNCRGEKVYGVIDLVDKVTRDEAAWTGKEVVVSGYARVHDGNTDQIQLDLVDDLYSGTENHVYCQIPKVSATDNLYKRFVTVKGKIGKVHTQNYLNMKTVTLDTCELVK